MEDIRKDYANAYMPWTEEEDEKLAELFYMEKSRRELARIFQRKRGAISSRLKKLGLI